MSTTALASRDNTGGPHLSPKRTPQGYGPLKKSSSNDDGLPWPKSVSSPIVGSNTLPPADANLSSESSASATGSHYVYQYSSSTSDRLIGAPSHTSSSPTITTPTSTQTTSTISFSTSVSSNPGGSGGGDGGGGNGSGSDLNSAVIIGGVVGGLVIICATILCLVYLLRKHPRNPRPDAAKATRMEAGDQPPQYAISELPDSTIQEVPGQGPQELSGTAVVAEMDNSD